MKSSATIRFAVVALLAAASILVASPAFGSRLLRCDLELVTGCCCESGSADASETRIQGACCCEVRDVAGTGSDGLAPAIEPRAEIDMDFWPARLVRGHAARVETVSFPNPSSAPLAQLASLLAQHTSLIV